MMALNSL